MLPFFLSIRNIIFSIIAIILSFSLIFYIYVIKYDNTQFSDYILNKIPNSIKNVPSFVSYQGKKRGFPLFGNLNYNMININDFKLKNNLNNYPILKKIPIKKKYSNSPAPFYIDIYQNKIFFAGKNGTFLYADQDSLKLYKIKTNLNKFINNLNRYNIILDIKIIKNQMYVSYIKDTNNQKCYNTSVLKTELDVNYFEFQEFFTFDDCVNNKKIREFKNKLNSVADVKSIWPVKPFIPVVFNKSGGRLSHNKKNNKMYLTIGTYGIRVLSQIENSFFGKIIEIDIDSGKSNIFSSGHRNAQGLSFSNDNNLLLSTEHGPKGGDEINLILKNKNYGWPITSYGQHYDGKYRKEAPLYKSHKKYGFKEPIYFFSPSIAISEIALIPNIDNKYNYNNYNYFVVSSLKSKKIIFIKYYKKTEKIKILKEIYIGERIRDVLVKDSSIYLALENSPSLFIMEIPKLN